MAVNTGEPIRLAMLVDGDNASPADFASVFKTVLKHGRITVCRIFGDWTQERMRGWLDVAKRNGARPVQQSQVAVGKNATDIAIVIDAIDLMHRGVVDGFALVSSDADFTPLALRLREEGKLVIGAGDHRATESFRRACNHFIETGTKAATARNGTTPAAGVTASKPINQKGPVPSLSGKQMETLRVAFTKTFAKCRLTDGWVKIGAFGKILREVQPGFTHKDYGSAQLWKLLERCDALIEIRRENNSNGQIDVRLIASD